ncbi:MAG: WYL domain-containing protein [Desulfobulbaceae bacterium]|nr:WYL domain-containing protein [Desulfobulbaceae bacterium]HIJ79163.1 WYL domain-containing protein [Deltaproteobacteria bacterium]
MAKDKNQLLRLLFIDRKIREGMRGGLLANCTSMAAEYEVSPKSILRDIDYLRNQRDAPIAYDSVKRGYYYTEENYALPAISLNESDLFAICIAEKALKQHEDTPIYQALQSVFQKIEASLPEKVSVQPAWVENRLSVVADHQTRIDPLVWQQLSDGLHRNRLLEIAYLKPGTEAATVRRVAPYHLVRYQGEWYLVGHCHLRGKVLTFAVSRIKESRLLNESFELPEDFDYERYGGQRFGIFAGEKEFEVRVWFDREHAPYVMERQWHPGQAVVLDQDDGLILSFPVRHVFEVKRWLLSWGRGVKVLGPPELAAAVQAELAAMLACYQT